MKINRSKREESETPASAMSDIAFLLIVFFMVIASFSLKEGFIMQLPEKDKVLKKASESILKVKIVKEDIFVSGEKTDKNDLRQTLMLKKQEGKKQVILEISSNTLYKDVIFVLDTFSKLKILDFSMKKIEEDSHEDKT